MVNEKKREKKKKSQTEKEKKWVKKRGKRESGPGVESERAHRQLSSLKSLFTNENSAIVSRTYECERTMSRVFTNCARQRAARGPSRCDVTPTICQSALPVDDDRYNEQLWMHTCDVFTTTDLCKKKKRKENMSSSFRKSLLMSSTNTFSFYVRHQVRNPLKAIMS